MATGYGRAGYSSGPYSEDDWAPPTQVWVPIVDVVIEQWTTLPYAVPTPPSED